MIAESRENRIKRMTMRSWRRGTKEMDLILGPYAQAHLAAMTDDGLDAFDALLAESDSDLYPWITGAVPCPDHLKAQLHAVATFSRNRPRDF